MSDQSLSAEPPLRLWSKVESLAEGCAPCTQRELWGWCAASVAALAVAGIFAVLLALSRIPGIQDVFPWPLDFFKKGLVIHVIFSFVVWFLGVFGALLHLATVRITGGEPKFRQLGRFALMSLGAAFFLLFLPAFKDRGEPILNNYVPVITDPLYYAGLAVLGAGILLEAVRLFLNLGSRKNPHGPLSLGLTLAAGIYAVALLCFALAYGRIAGDAVDHTFNESLFWGGGHVLQFVNVTLLAVAWYMLGGMAFGAPLGSERLHTAAVVLPAVFAALAPLFYLAFDGARQPEFTDLQYALAPPALLAAGTTAIGILGHRADKGGLPWRDPAFVCLVLSIGVFGLGGLLGLFVDGTDTRTPAHYHGVIAGINLAFMGLFFRLFLPLLDRQVKRGKALFAQVWLFGLGQGFASLGLFLAGGYGTPRKMAGAEQGLTHIAQKIGMTMNGVGAAIAVIGGVMFIWTVSAALLRRPRHPSDS
ncbi:MAG: cbb3-type cytochrome c oxidase subunit I [Magnetospirillum sp. WYHS-4]